MLRFVSLVVLLAVFAGCAAVPTKPLTGIVPGREVETVQSAVTISIRTPQGSRGGRGFLVFKRPDRFHMAILSPFGLTLLDVFSADDRLTCLVPSRNTAYSGTIDQLPAREGLRSWGLMRWIVEKTPVAGPAIRREQVTADGRREEIYYDRQGLVVRKETEDGDRVAYKEYHVYDGVAFPSVIELATADGEEVRLTFDDPELNKPVDDSVLTPQLAGVTVLPFSAFRGF